MQHLLTCNNDILLNLGVTNMKKILPVAVLAALTGVNAAQAVHVNPDGTGQVLVFPFYTVEGNQDTYINLVNTTDEFKAVKVRILESMNSQEVLDFNLYLSPNDHWSAVITTADAGGGAAIQSYDTSCTVPLPISNNEKINFRTFQFSQDSVNTAARTREGYIEVIEMATITDADYQADIKHVAGVPGDCGDLDESWRANGEWDQTEGDAGVTGVTGGLYGWGVLIDPEQGTEATYDAIAIDDWITSNGPGFFHSGPGDTLPSIASDADFDYSVFDEGGVVSGSAFNGADAVSTVFMQAAIANDYVLEADVLGGTDWVVTFPTKTFYVNATPPIEPFTNDWNSQNSTACETFGIEYWDREEGAPVDPVNPNDFSPLPPPGETPTFSFCYEANVLTFNESNVLAASARTGVNLNLESGFENGWARIDFTGSDVGTFGNDRVLQTQDHAFSGLPVVGFAVQRSVNLDVDEAVDGIRAYYAGDVLHKGSRDIISSSVAF
jgi:hypothetical protein